MRLWDKGGEINETVAAFTTGSDPRIDLAWASHDVTGSVAHVQTQQAAGLLTAEEAGALLSGLATVRAEIEAGAFSISTEQEDVHTAVEARLHALLGPVAGKVHTGRSRNDQILTTLRLWQRDFLADLHAGTLALGHAWLDQAARYQDLPLPGYTHLQRAMPSSWGLWFSGFAGALCATLPLIRAAQEVVDRCPLGSAAGYGTPLPLDRDLSARLLGFSRPERPVTAPQLTRGLDASACLHAAAAVLAVVSRFASDVALYATAEFSLLSLPEALTTGSSIMPQKRNPDVAELLRAQVRRVRACQRLIEDIPAGLPSGYHRELQLCKAPLLEGAQITLQALAVCLPLIRGISPKPVDMDDELYATSEAFRRARESGRPFREVYREVGIEVKEGRFSAEERAGAPSAEIEEIRAVLLGSLIAGPPHVT